MSSPNVPSTSKGVSGFNVSSSTSVSLKEAKVVLTKIDVQVPTETKTKSTVSLDSLIKKKVLKEVPSKETLVLVDEVANLSSSDDICRGCQKPVKYLLKHFRFNKECESHYDLDLIRKEASLKKRNLDKSRLALNRDAAKKQDPVAYTEKVRSEKESQRRSSQKIDPVAYTEKVRSEKESQRRSFQRIDPLAYAEKRQEERKKERFCAQTSDPVAYAEKVRVEKENQRRSAQMMDSVRYNEKRKVPCSYF